jgi:hypothetical protein
VLAAVVVLLGGCWGLPRAHPPADTDDHERAIGAAYVPTASFSFTSSQRVQAPCSLDDAAFTNCSEATVT